LWCGRYTERTKEEREKLMEVLVGLMRESKVRIVINAKIPDTDMGIWDS